MQKSQNGDVFLFSKIIKKPFFITITALSFIAVLLRIISLSSNIEAETGFYINPYSFFRIFLIIILILTFIFGFVWFYISKKYAILPVNLKFDFTNVFSQRKILAIVTLGFAANTFYDIFRISNPLPSIVLPQSSSVFTTLTALSSALCLCYFIILSFLTENKKVATSLLTVLPVIWIIFRLLRNFISYTTVTTISKNLLDTLYLCALLITMLCVSRLLCDSSVSKGYKGYIFFAPISIVLGFVLSIPPIICFIFGAKSVGESDIFMHLVDLGLSIYLLYFGMNIYKEA